jgi:RNA polymerase sigma factor (sigma-70 family)
MAQYKTANFEALENTELARKSYLEYERGKDDPDEAEVEADWKARRKKLRSALLVLTPRQREVFVLKIANQMTEAQIACRLNITQQAVSKLLGKAQIKLRNFKVNNAKQ